jgi:Uri superfamily endonuclease
LQCNGAYVLLINLSEGQIIQVGRLGEIYFPTGTYAYTGSAQRAFRIRLSRYLKPIYKYRWHIDYLLQKASLSRIFLAPSKKMVECHIARYLDVRLETEPGFGSSDCHCPGHLFFNPTEEAVQSAVMGALGSLDITPITMETADIKATLGL